MPMGGEYLQADALSQRDISRLEQRQRRARPGMKRRGIDTWGVVSSCRRIAKGHVGSTTLGLWFRVAENYLPATVSELLQANARSFLGPKLRVSDR